MSHFNLNNNSSSFLASINALGEDYYPKTRDFPSGKVVIQNTSFGKEGISGRTLTSRVASDALTAAGDVAYRSPLYSTKFTQEMLNSSANSFFTSGAQIAYGTNYLKVVDEDAPSFRTDTDSDGNSSATGYSTVTGGTAFTKLMSNTIAGRAGGQDFINRAITEIEAQSTTGGTDGSADGSGSSGATDVEDESNAGAVTAGAARALITSSNMTEEEKGWLQERAQLLYDKGPGYPPGENLDGVVTDRGNGLVSGFNFDLPNGMTDLKYYLSSYYPGYNQDTETQAISQAEIDAGSIKAYVYPSMIELLLYLSDKIIIQGGFGFQRANLQQIENEALAAEAAGQEYSVNRFRISSGHSVPAHAKGSAFDIDLIGSKDQSTIVNLNNDGNDVGKHREALLILLAALDSAPVHLIPDYIKFHDGLATEYSIASENDFELETTPLKVRFPRLKYVDFAAASNHRTHIHMHFSGRRCGQYILPGILGAAGTVSGGSGTDATSGYDPETGKIFIPGLGSFPTTPGGGSGQGGDTISLPSNTKFTQLYKTEGMQLVANEIYSLLTNICCPELAAIMTAISQREGNVSSLNASIVESGDWSYGFLQNNLYGTHGRVEVLVPYPTPTTIHAWKLAAPGWAYFGLNSWEQWKGFVLSIHNSVSFEEFEKSSRDGSDDRLWYPINQAYIAYKFMCGTAPTYPLPENAKLGLRPGDNGGKMQHVLTPWGDYGGVPGGPLYGVKWTDAKAVYLANNTGKTEDDLKKWIRDYFSNPGNGATSKSAPYIEFWLAGGRILRNGQLGAWE